MTDSLCVGCDVPAEVNDRGLCPDCYAKLERDLVRSRDWAYSALAFSLRDRERKALRRRVIADDGAAYELIEPPSRAKHAH